MTLANPAHATELPLDRRSFLWRTGGAIRRLGAGAPLGNRADPRRRLV